MSLAIGLSDLTYSISDFVLSIETYQ